MGRQELHTMSFNGNTGRYVVTKRIGGYMEKNASDPSVESRHGACSVVYEARDEEKADELVVIKVMLNYCADDLNTKSIKQRFEDESRLLLDKKRLPPHDNMISVTDNFVANAKDGLPEWDFDPDIVNPKTTFLVMPRLERDLLHVLKDERPMPEEKLSEMMDHVLAACEHLNKCGIAHRDIKADNILTRNEHGVVTYVVTDLGECFDREYLGLADFRFPFEKHARTFNRGGAPAYQAPEIARAEAGPGSVLDYTKTDAWSCGMMFHLCASDGGHHPFSSQDPREFKDGDYHEPSGEYGPRVRGVIEALLIVDSAKRSTCTEARSSLSGEHQLIEKDHYYALAEPPEKHLEAENLDDAKDMMRKWVSEDPAVRYASATWWAPLFNRHVYKGIWHVKFFVNTGDTPKFDTYKDLLGSVVNVTVWDTLNKHVNEYFSER